MGPNRSRCLGIQFCFNIFINTMGMGSTKSYQVYRRYKILVGNKMQRWWGSVVEIIHETLITKIRGQVGLTV